MSVLTEIQSKIETDLTEYEIVAIGIGLDFEDFKTQYSSFNNGVFINWLGIDAADEQLEDFKTNVYEDTIIIYLKNTTILDKLTNLLNVLDGYKFKLNNRYKYVKFVNSMPISNDYQDVLQINFSVIG